MSLQKNVILILGIIVIIFTSYFIYTKFIHGIDKNNIEVKEMSQEIDDWEVYYYKLYGFQIFYPKNWNFYVSATTGKLSFFSPQDVGENSMNLMISRCDPLGATCNYWHKKITSPDVMIDGIGAKRVNDLDPRKQAVVVEKDGFVYELRFMVDKKEQTTFNTEEKLIWDKFISTFKFINDEKRESGLFSPLNNPVSPKFLNNIQKTDDVSFELIYTTPENNFGFTQNTVKDNNGKTFLAILNDPEYRSSNKFRYSIFSPEGSHNYGGSGLKVSDLNSKYAISYIGFKANNLNLIESLKTEVVLSMHDEVGYYFDGSQGKGTSFFNKILNIENVYACGPSNIVDLVGESDLELVKVENDIYWYQLKTPIQLYNLPAGPCYDNDGELKSDMDCQYCDYCTEKCNFFSIHNQEHYDCLAVCDYYCFKWSDWSSMRLNIFYRPNIEANDFMSVQVSNIVLQDLQGNYFEPSFDNNFSNYYKAYLYLPE